MPATDQATVPSFMDRQPRMAAADGFSFPKPRSFTLSNGVRVLLLEKHDLPLVNIRVTLPAGISREPAAQPGVAYVTSQMLLEGAGKRSALQLATTLLDLGASLRSYVDEDFAAVSLQVLTKNLAAGMDVWHDVLCSPRMTARDFKRVLGEMAGRAQQRRARPAFVAYMAFKAAVFGQHAYAQPVLPLPSQLKRLKLEQIKQFHRRSYVPSGALMVAAGDITPARLRHMLEQRLCTWTTSGAAAAPRTTAPPPKGPRLVLVDRPGATQSALRVGHLAPARRTKDYTAIRVLNTMLGGSFTSRLNQNLREKHGFTYGVRSSFSLLRDRGLFSVSTTVETKNSVAALEQIFIELQAMARRPVSKRELAKAARLVIEEQPEQAETSGGLVQAYTSVATHGIALVSLQRLSDEVAALTPDTIQQLARRVLRPSQATIVVAGDLAVIGDPLQKLYGKADYRDLDGLPTSP